MSDISNPLSVFDEARVKILAMNLNEVAPELTPIEQIESAVVELMICIHKLPDSRPKSIALTNIETGILWLQKATAVSNEPA